MPEAVIVATARSPIGRAVKGSLATIRPDDLAAQMVRAVLDKVPSLDPADIDDLMMGNAQPAGEAGYNIARAVAVELGYDFLPGTTVNRYCSSSLQTTRMAFHAIKAGEGDVFVSAGVETVSRFGVGAADGAPNSMNSVFDEARARTTKQAEGDIPWHDPREDGQIPDVYIAMGQTAENVATFTGISREDQDHWGVRSQNRAEAAIENGFFEREISPVTLPDGTVVSTDDGPRAGTTYEKISQLKPVFRPNGTITAGNACPLNDGAAAVVVMSDTKARELGLTPLARIVSTSVSGLSPEIMGLGPIEAIRKALAKADKQIGDIDLVEINEAFAVQVIGSARELGIDEERLNVSGGAIALGHPFGMTGAHHGHAAEQPCDARQNLRHRVDVRWRWPGYGNGRRAAQLARRVTTLGTPLSVHATRVMLLGSGELGREVLIALQRLGVETIAVDRYDNAPGHQVAHHARTISMTDPDQLRALIEAEKPLLVVPEIEAIATPVLEELEAQHVVRVVPTARAARLTMDREGIRRLAAETLGLPTSPYRFCDSLEELQAAAREIGYPCVVKPVMSSSGKGQSTIDGPDGVAAARVYAMSGSRVAGARIIVEGFVDFDYEITLLTVRARGADGEVDTSFCEPIGHRQVSGDYVESWQPHPMPDTALERARRIAQAVTADLGGQGVFGVELFVKGDQVWFSEVSPRPHDTGMVTMVTQWQNEFELHARAILGLPVDTTLKSPGASAVIYGGVDAHGVVFDGVDAALQVPHTDIRLFGKPESFRTRRMGVALAFDDDVSTARRNAADAASRVTPRAV